MAGLIQAPDYDWTSSRVVAGFAIGAAGLIAFAIVELRAARPMLDLRFFRDRGFSLGSFSIAAAYFALFTQYLQTRARLPAIDGRALRAARGLTQFAVATVARPLVVRHGIRAVLAGGLLACTAGLLTLTS